MSADGDPSLPQWNPKSAWYVRPRVLLCVGALFGAAFLALALR